MKTPWFIIDPNNPEGIEEIEADDVQTEVPKGFKTFHEWSSEGFGVLKGSRASWFNGIAYFNQSQVCFIEQENIWGDEDYDDEPFAYEGYWDY